MTLTDLVTHISLKFPQINLLIDELDYMSNNFNKKSNTKYLFRGENDVYPATKSNYHRLIESSKFDKVQLEALNNYILDLSIHLNKMFFQILDRNDPRYHPVIIEVGGFLQHYGFPIMWLDFTSDINIAAFFASYKNVTKKGRICVIETSNVTKDNQLFKLNKSFARRPSIQKAFALRMYNDNQDLKDSIGFKTNWFDFELTESDMDFQKNESILSTENDNISSSIITYLEANRLSDKDVQEYLDNIKSDLIHCP